VLRETDPQTTIWELLLPEAAKRLPADLQAVDAYLDERFIAPWRALFSARLGRPSVPIDTLLRRHVADSRHRKTARPLPTLVA
jgi:transposase, IS5 family